MDKRMRGWAAAGAVGCALWSGAVAHAQQADGIDTSAGNLLAVLRESAGENKPDDTLAPYGRIAARMPNGERVELNMSWYRYLGDMHIRLVFDGGRSLQSAEPDDLERLRLTPEDAVDVAVRNLRRVYGTPQAVPWSGGLMQVRADAPELSTSYFLDREFWDAIAKQHPAGVVAALPQRDGLVFAPADDEAALSTLRFSAAAMYAGDAGTRLSSALYLFKDGRWSVFQPPMPIAQ